MIGGFGYFVTEAWMSLWRNRGAATLSILTIAIAVFVLGLFLLVAGHVQRTVDRWSRSAELSVYLRDETPEDRTDRRPAGAQSRAVGCRDRVRVEERGARAVPQELPRAGVRRRPGRRQSAPGVVRGPTRSSVGRGCRPRTSVGPRCQDAGRGGRPLRPALAGPAGVARRVRALDRPPAGSGSRARRRAHRDQRRPSVAARAARRESKSWNWSARRSCSSGARLCARA